MAKRKIDAPAKANSERPVKVDQVEGEGQGKALARALSAPHLRHSVAATQLLKKYYAEGADQSPELADFAEIYAEQGKKAADGDLGFASRMLANQAISLDMIFTEMVRRMACNMGEYMGATETYARIAMKAQANSRATLEALAKLHQPREQTVRHVHVNEGGQAVIADQFHHHQTGGPENGHSFKQPHAPLLEASVDPTNSEVNRHCSMDSGGGKSETIHSGRFSD